MAKKPRTRGPVIRSPLILHGKSVRLVRGGKEVSGLLTSKDGQLGISGRFTFQWTNDNGENCISDVSEDEIMELKEWMREF